MDDICLLYTTWPDADTAEQAARTVVEEGLAACANLLGAGVSIYRWQGSVERAPETVMILKTARATAPVLRDRILQLHPYDTPAVLALPVLKDRSSVAFENWVLGETVAAPESRSNLATPEAK
jgi:periplasmic divalent cation tolerance protein